MRSFLFIAARLKSTLDLVHDSKSDVVKPSFHHKSELRYIQLNLRRFVGS